jgi:ABC-type uncharacterized transport system substrate-binding protein
LIFISCTEKEKKMPIFRRGYLKVLPGLLSLWIVFCSNLPTSNAESFRTSPTTNNGKQWRIGYYEGGPYINYPANLKAIVKGLAKLGWMSEIRFEIPEDPTDSARVWLVLSESKGDYLQFVRKAYSSADWDDEKRKQNREAVLDRLAGNHLDFIIAMGTWAGQDLANNRHSVPTMVVSTSDPIKSGIIKSATRSGFDHVHAKCDPRRYLRQLRLFHDIIGFKRLGIVYEYTDVGKTYAALSDVERVANRRGFTLVPCEARWSGVPQEVRTREVMECHKQLAPQIDALYVTVHAGIDANYMDELLRPLMAHKIPTWSQRGPQEVRHGVLLSISRKGFGAVGLYHAFIMARIFNGAKPGDLNQIFEDPKHIAINLKTATAISFNPPKGLLKVADTIYK